MDTEVYVGGENGTDCPEQQGTQERQFRAPSGSDDMGASSKATKDYRQGELGFPEANGRMEDESEVSRDQLEKEKLTVRQLEVLKAFRSGKSAPKAAAILCVPACSVKKHLKDIRDRLGVKSSAELLNQGDVVIGTPTVDTITGARLLELVEEQQYRCALSGMKLEPADAVLDHKIPRNRGGKHELSNVWWLHRDVNSAKGTMTVDEFRLMCSRVVQWGT